MIIGKITLLKHINRRKYYTASFARKTMHKLTKCWTLVLLFSISLFASSISNSINELNENVQFEVIGRAPADWDWSTSYGSTPGNDQGWGIVVDSTDSSFVTGSFTGTVTFGNCASCTHTSQGDNDIYIAKLDPAGVVQWVNTAGGVGGDAPIGHITELDNGDFAITGYVEGDFSAQFDSITLNPTGVRALFVATFDGNGNWVWAKQWSGAHTSSEILVRDITSDTNFIYVTGDFTRSFVFDGITYGANTNGNPGFRDLFVAKIKMSGSDVWARVSDGYGSDGGRGVAVSDTGDVYVSGLHANNANFGSTTLQTATNLNCGYNPSEGLVAKLDSQGNWIWAISHPGCHFQEADDIEVTPTGDVVFSIDYTNQVYLSDISGTATSPIGTGAYGASHGFTVVKYDPSGNFIWHDSVFNYDNHVVDVIISSNSDVFLCGYGTNYGNLDSSHSNTLLNDQWDNLPVYNGNIWIAKMASSGELEWLVASGGFGSSGQSVPRHCALDSDSIAYVTGHIDGEVMFDVMASDSGGIANHDGVKDSITAKLADSYATQIPDPCASFNSTTGPVWEENSSNPVTIGQIYEYPENSGNYWQVIQNSQVTPNPGDSIDIWSEPCTCLEIWSGIASPLVWDSSSGYNPNVVVEYPAGSYQLWVAIIPNANQMPDPSNPQYDQYWERCRGTECAQFNGQGGPIFDETSTVTVSIGDIYEYPAYSGSFWIAINDVILGTPGTINPGFNDDVWGLSCNCSEIWSSVGEPTWDPVDTYLEYEIVESPLGSGDLWSLNIPTTSGGLSPEFSNDWDGCGDPLSPCEEAAASSNNWPMWTVSGSPYSVGDVVSYGNQFFVSIRPQNSVEPGPQGVQALAWIECTCDDIMSQLPSFDSAMSYAQYDGVVYNNEVYWAISQVPAGTNPGPNQHWRTCDWCDSSTNNIEGEWSEVFAGSYGIGELVTDNGVIWVSIMQNNPTIPTGGVVIMGVPWPTPTPLPMWDIGWVECDCSEVATTYDSSVVYDEGDVVIGPDGNTWISEYSNNMNWPSIVWNWNNWFTFTIPTWRMCSVSTCADAIPWDQNTALYGGYFSGDAVSHVGTSWVLMQGQSGTSIEPSLSMILNPGPWATCNPTPIGNVSMLSLSNGYTNVETKSIITVNLSSNKSTSDSMEDGMMFERLDIDTVKTVSSDISSAILLEQSVTEMENETLEMVVQENILVVDVCDQKYNLNGLNEKKYLCGFWYEEVTINSRTSNQSRIILGPGMLCPEKTDGCIDVILKIEQSNGDTEPQKESTDDDTSDSVPGFTFEIFIAAFIMAIIALRRKYS
ncbi:MAG: hypothetical protein ACPHDO_03805 [Candidatus Poseidoniaceae archaeon]